jgi:hypothetical protein
MAHDSGNVGDMSATWQNVAYFCPDRANLATWFLVCRHTFVSRFSDIDVPRTDVRLSVLLIPTSNVDLHNRSPQQKAPKNHPPPPSPRVASSPLAASSPHVTPALFVCLSVCLFLWLVVASSLCPLSLRPFPSRRRATSLHYVPSLVVPLVIVESSRRCVSSRLVVVSCPLTQLVAPALFDCCVYCRHQATATAATVAVAVPPPPCRAVPLPPPPRRRALSCSRSRSRRSSGSIRRRHRDST